MATQKVKPIPRASAQINLSKMVLAAGVKTTDEAVDFFLGRFLAVAIGADERTKLIDFLNAELGTKDIARARSYMEDPLRMLVHLIMSQPEYQLG
jgi:hypothetical protein